ALAVRMCIRRCGVSVSGRLHSVAQRLDVVDLIGEMVHARQPLIWCPAFRGLLPRLTQGDVGFIGAYMDPSRAIVTYAFAAYSEFRKCCLQEMDHALDVAHTEVRVFQPDSHCIPPMRPKSLKANPHRLPYRGSSRIALTRAQNSARGLFDQNEESPTLPLGLEFGACRSAKTGTNQVSVKLDWRPQVYCFVTSKSVVLFCSLSSKLALAVLPSAATVILKTPITLLSRLSVSSSMSLPII